MQANIAKPYLLRKLGENNYLLTLQTGGGSVVAILPGQQTPDAALDSLGVLFQFIQSKNFPSHSEIDRGDIEFFSERYQDSPENGVSPKTQRPPLGLRPLWYIREERLAEIEAAILRYVMAEMPVPNEWVAEAQTLQSALQKPTPDA